MGRQAAAPVKLDDDARRLVELTMPHGEKIARRFERQHPGPDFVGAVYERLVHDAPRYDESKSTPEQWAIFRADRACRSLLRDLAREARWLRQHPLEAVGEGPAEPDPPSPLEIDETIREWRGKLLPDEWFFLNEVVINGRNDEQAGRLIGIDKERARRRRKAALEHLRSGQQCFAFA